ncbi:farnesol dehydrogenase-like isoform X1 [Hermetia illucens]|uniref:farnesol dehydrogenase-like isoform X1 n=1 Tax=Hermetia illucens TaxID=343691 RepID=UPI0018CC544E|nr:farnesol dehydrogenase-like isoform X1 [Hermetia illucens]
MERWHNRVAVITGASSGIGAATLEDLATAGVTVVGLSRRPNRINKKRLTFPVDVQCRVHALECDITNEENVKSAFKWVEDHLGGTDILINSAGVLYQGCLSDENSTHHIRNTFDVQIMGTVFCTREAFQSMKRRNFDGHVIHINSIYGHRVPNLFNMDSHFFTNYSASKYAVTAMNEVYRQEFANAGTRVKVTSISPGLTCTPIANNLIEVIDVPVLNAHDVSNAILHCLGTPPHVQVHELIIKPIGEVF